jgi:hypothetical protein
MGGCLVKLSHSTRVREFRLGPALLALTALRLGLHVTEEERLGKKGQSDLDLARCDREIAEARAALRAGHLDIEGLCLAIHDWSGERRLIEAARKDPA